MPTELSLRRTAQLRALGEGVISRQVAHTSGIFAPLRAYETRPNRKGTAGGDEPIAMSGMTANAPVSTRRADDGDTAHPCVRPVQRIRLDHRDEGERRSAPSRAGARTTGGHPAPGWGCRLSPASVRGIAQPSAPAPGMIALLRLGGHAWPLLHGHHACPGEEKQW